MEQLKKPLFKKRLNSFQTALHSNMRIRNIKVRNKRTSIRIEPSMWNALVDICKRERCTIDYLATAIANHKTSAHSISAALRLFAFQYYKEAATETGHQQSNHGNSIECCGSCQLDDDDHELERRHDLDDGGSEDGDEQAGHQEDDHRHRQLGGERSGDAFGFGHALIA